MQQMQEQYGCQGKKLYFASVDLEKKTFDNEYLERSLGSKEGKSGGMVGECSHGDVRGCTDSS